MKHFEPLLFLISLLLAVFFINQSRYLRGLAYETIPDSHVTDEYDYVWQALSLKKYGLPVAWTLFNGVYSSPKYQAEKGSLQGLGIVVSEKIVDVREFKKKPKPVTAVAQIDWGKGPEHMLFVVPFFDHPPLGGLIYSLGVNKDTSQFDQVKPADFRRPALILAIITAVLLYIFIFQITGKPLVAALSTAVYSTVPTYIFATRGAYLENVSPPFILSHLVLLLTSIHFLKKRRFTLACFLIFFSGFLGGLGGLSKESSLGFLLGSLIIVLAKRVPAKYVWALIAGVTLPIMIYIGWAFWLQRDLFIGVIAANLARNDFGSLKFLTILESLRFRGFPIDGWWIWGIVSAFIVSLKVNLKKNNYGYLALPLFCDLLAVVFMANSNYPWYWLPMIPFLAGASAIIIGDLLVNPSFLGLMIFFFLPVSSSFYWGYSVFHQNSGQNLNLYRAGFLILLTLYLLRKYMGHNKYGRYFWIVAFSLLLFEASKWNFQSIQYFVAHWGNFPVPSIPDL
jgi:hypothetical protein